ncbi:MAG TPA: oligosaccharide flippase family protein [Steroidobacteraceae bacterium]|nr:oligosaccharide flippase family protein [Steroidobacteraceae bacterium]
MAARSENGVLARTMSAGVLQRARAAVLRSDGTRKLAADTMWVALDSLGARGLALLAMMLAARLLGVREFGELAAVLGTATLVAGLLADSMRYTAATQIAASTGATRAVRSGIVTLVIWATAAAAMLCALGMLLCAPLLARRVFAAASLEPALRVAALFLLCEALGGLAQGILTGFRFFRTLAATGLARGLLALPLVAVYGTSTVSALWAFVLASAAALVIRAAAIGATLRSQGLSARAPITAAELAVLWRVSVPGLMASLITVPVNWLAMVMLVRSPGGYAQMGVLGAANQWFSVLLFIPSILTTVTLPLFSQRYASGDTESLRRALGYSLRMSLLAAAPPALVVAAASPWIMAFYGPEFVRGWPALALVAVAAITSSMINMLLNLLGAAGGMFRVLASQLCWGVAYLLSAYVLLGQGLGAAAIAAAMLLGSVCRLAFGAYWVRRIV